MDWAAASGAPSWGAAATDHGPTMLSSAGPSSSTSPTADAELRLQDFAAGLAQSARPAGAAGAGRRSHAAGGGAGAEACSADGCRSDLSRCREYHRRHKVCEAHSRTPVVVVAGQEQRFCQQCSRFHMLSEFDEGKRSCRKTTILNLPPNFLALAPLPEAARVRSPAEEGRDAGTGSSSWPRSRRYAVGDEVEVLLTGQGFRGARYEATVTARLPDSGRYEVVYSTLIKRRGGPLREVVAASDIRPRPPPPPGRDLELFDLVEAYHGDGWWPGVVSDIRPKRRRNKETQFTVSFPLFREVVKLSASFVRPRREFVYGSWIDAQEVLRGIPQYAEGSRIEVMCDKLGRDWRPAIIKKMVSSTSYVVSYVKGKSSIEVLHSRFIRPEPNHEMCQTITEALAGKRKAVSVSSLDHIEIGSKYSFGNVVVISDDSSHGSFIEISDGSSYNPIKMQRRMNLPDEELLSNDLIHNHQAPRSASRLWQEQNPQLYLLPDASRHSKEHACRNVLSQSMEPLESSQDHYHKDVGQRIPLPGCQVQEFLGRNEAVEPRPLDHLHLENVLMKIDDSAAGGENEMCQTITEVNCWVAGTSIEGAANQKTVNQPYGGAFPVGKLEPSSSRLQDFEGSPLCIEAPNYNKVNTENKKTDISPEDEAAFLIGKLEPPSFGQKGVKADLMCIEACNHNKVEIKNERMGMSLVTSEGFHLETCMRTDQLFPADKDIAIVSYPECNALQEPWGQPLEPVSEKSAGPSSLLHPVVSNQLQLAVPKSSSDLSSVFSATSLLLMPRNIMEVFEKIPQIPHFRKAWNCAPELREGRALGLMHSFATLAESIKNMQIQDEPRLYEEKMSILLDMEEENGFEAGPLKARLHNLLCTRNCQINLKNRKVRLEKEILELEAVNCGLDQRLKVLDMCVTGMELKKYQETKASLDMQKKENCSSITKLQINLCQVEESLKYVEADFCSISTAPWQLDAASLLQ